jgi:membrane-bound lytic murein transglycosylase B
MSSLIARFRRTSRVTRHRNAAGATRLVLTAAVVLVAAAPAARAQEAPAAPPPTIVDPVRPGDRPRVLDTRLDEALAGVAVTGPAVDNAFARYDADRRALDDERRREADARHDIAELTAARDRVQSTVNQATRRRDKAAATLTRLRTSLAAIAVADYVGERGAGAELDVDLGRATEARRRAAVTATVRGQQLVEARQQAAIAAEHADIAAAAGAELGELTARGQAADARLADALARQQQLAGDLVTDTQAVADARLTSTVRDRDLALVALDAYYRAARRLAAEQPSCRIPWHLLAGIGRTESGHGTVGGATLDASGAVSKPIIGIPLDGNSGTAVVTDTDGGTLDGDPVGDRAVGPMQFIPSTWARWGRDGNGDGKNDPQNMYDAALAAANYLCVYGPGLDTDPGVRGAVIHYNADESYVDLVQSRSQGYGTLALPAPG